MFEHTFIGLDVHAVDVVGCALNPETGELVRKTMPADPAMVLEWVRRLNRRSRQCTNQGRRVIFWPGSCRKQASIAWSRHLPSSSEPLATG